MHNRRQAWSTYWAGGELHSCVGSYGGNYEGAIAGFWHRHFAALASGARMLDLATGNGALPLLVSQQRGDTGIDIDAVDLASVAPSWHQSTNQAQIAFHPGVSMEALPFPDAGFDLVTSQFGLEYASWPQAVHEAMRVCKPSGTCAFVLHHVDSVLVRVGRHEIANLELLMAPDGLLATAAAVLPWTARARAGDPGLVANTEALACRQRYNQAMDAIGTAIASNPVPDLLLEARGQVHALISTVNNQPGPELATLDAYREALNAAMLRTGEMIEHALDRAQADALVDTLRGSRTACIATVEVVADEHGILGWGVVIAPEASAVPATPVQ